MGDSQEDFEVLSQRSMSYVGDDGASMSDSRSEEIKVDNFDVLDDNVSKEESVFSNKENIAGSVCMMNPGKDSSGEKGTNIVEVQSDRSTENDSATSMENEAFQSDSSNASRPSAPDKIDELKCMMFALLNNNNSRYSNIENSVQNISKSVSQLTEELNIQSRKQMGMEKTNESRYSNIESSVKHISKSVFELKEELNIQSRKQVEMEKVLAEKSFLSGRHELDNAYKDEVNVKEATYAQKAAENPKPSTNYIESDEMKKFYSSSEKTLWLQPQNNHFAESSIYEFNQAISLREVVDEAKILIADTFRLLTQEQSEDIQEHLKYCDEILSSYYSHHLDLQDDFISSLSLKVQNLMQLMEHRKILMPHLDKGVSFLKSKTDLDTLVKGRPGVKLFVLFFNLENYHVSDVWGLFDRIVEESNDEYSFYIYDLPTDEDAYSNDIIKVFLDGECIIPNFLENVKQVEKQCCAKAIRFEKASNPDKKILFEAPCPLAFDGIEKDCEASRTKWLCINCGSFFEYGFDHHLYCSCGTAKITDVRFRCNKAGHVGNSFANFKGNLDTILNNLKSFDGLTVLILGETGVGKSTFINGFANYMHFETLEEAKSSDQFLSPVKSTFIMTNENLEQTVISTGNEDNESTTVGQSATQEAKAHVFSYKGSKVRLIDTPGIGDTRGIDQDKKNFQNILSYLSYYQEIHGICILMKPNNSRLTLMFEFCLKELLIHLHKSAAQNIVFCFTNARNTNYRPGDTYPALKELLDRHKEQVAIELKKENVFCMDNEAFRYLAACKQGIQFTEDDDETYGVSWKRSRKETDRMMTHISGLKPHRVKDTLSINDVRQKILNLTKPLAEIAKHIDTTISNIEDHKIEIKETEKTAEEIFAAIKISVPRLEMRMLNYPRTVCTSMSCSEVHQQNGENIKKFNMYCHEHCYLSGVETDVTNNPALQSCAAMSKSRGISCHVCGCSWNTHMHVTYELVPILKDEEDKAAKERYRGIQDRKLLKEKVLNDLETQAKELEDEKIEIVKASAQFGFFLKKNSILPYNDAMINYLTFLIKQEKEKASQTGNYAKVESLSVLKLQYQEQVRIIEEAIARSSVESTSNDGILNLTDIDSSMQNLFHLKNFGSNVKDVLVSIEEAKHSKISHEERHYDASSVSFVSRIYSTATSLFPDIFKSTINYFFHGKRFKAIHHDGNHGGKLKNYESSNEYKEIKQSYRGRAIGRNRDCNFVVDRFNPRNGRRQNGRSFDYEVNIQNERRRRGGNKKR